MFSRDKIFYRLEDTPAPQWADHPTLNYVTLYPMKDRPIIIEAPEIPQKKMADLKYDLPAGVELGRNSYARNKLMWVQLTRENILIRDDLLENTRETVQRIIHLTDFVRILMRRHMQGDQVPTSLTQMNHRYR